MPPTKRKATCKLISRTQETDDVVTLGFATEDGSAFPFIAGQYVIIYPGGQLGPMGKAYTISNAPGDAGISVSVKKIGKFSTALHALDIGSAVALEGPMGSFFPEEHMREIVFLAAGIGVTPFMSIIRAYAREGRFADKEISLFYSNRTRSDIVFFDELNALAERYPRLSVFHYVTRQWPKDPHIHEFQRMDIGSITGKLTRFKEKDYFICGPIRFVSDIRRALLDGGVDGLRVHTEAFY